MCLCYSINLRGCATTTAIRAKAHAVDVRFKHDALYVVVADGREISALLEWFVRLRGANESQRQNWRFLGKGVGIHWPEIDEDIAVSTLMRKG